MLFRGALAGLLAVSVAIAMVIPAAVGLASALDHSPVPDIVPTYMVPRTHVHALPPGAEVLASYDDYDFVSSPVRPDAPGIVEMDHQIKIWGVGESFDPAVSSPSIPSGFGDDWSARRVDDPVYGLVQFAAPMKDEWRSASRGLGVELIQPLSGFSYIARGTPDAFAGLSSAPEVRWVGEYHHYYKFRGGLWEELQAADPEAEASLWLFVFDQDNAAVQGIIDFTERAGGRVVEHWHAWQWPDTVKLKVKWKHVPEIVRWHGVYTASIDYPGHSLNDQGSWGLQTDIQNNRALFDKGITGKGIVLAVADTGVNKDHVNFKGSTDKIVRIWPCGDSSDGGGHGSHVSGTVLGDGGASGVYDATTYDGMAFEARLSFQDIVAGSSWTCMTPSRNGAEAVKDGAVAEGNSWSTNNCDSSYDSAAQDADQFSWDTPGFLFAFAAGNRGPSGGNICSPGAGKNVLGVGGSQRGGSKTMYTGSSSGPTDDGRIKPTIMTPGQGQYSVQATGTYTSMSGTSMSTPGAVGMAGLVAQYFREGWYPGGTKGSGPGFSPSSAVMRAALINSGLDMKAAGGNPGKNIPDDVHQGYGKIKLDDTLTFSGGKRKLWVYDGYNASPIDPGLKTGESKEFVIDVAAGDPLRLTLAWNDWPGANIVNDLNLMLTSPLGKMYAGNDMTNGESNVGGAKVDSKNVEEMALIKAPEAGKWKITVSAVNVAQGGAQKYALLANGDLSAGGGGGAIARIDVSPAIASITADQTQQFAGKAYDANNNQVNATFGWTASGGSVDTTGMFAPGQVGSFTVSAAASGKSGSAQVTVTPGAATMVSISPPTASLTMGNTVLFTASGQDSKGNPISSGYSWTATAGSVSTGGLYTPDKVGNWKVTVHHSGKSATADVEVAAGALAWIEVDPPSVTIRIDKTTKFTARGLDASGNVVAISPTWSSNSGTISLDGTFTPQTTGVWKVTATQGAISGSADVTVTPGPPVLVEVLPATKSAGIGEVVTFTAKASDAKGDVLTGGMTTWELIGDPVGTIDGAGKVTTKAPGTARVKATVSANGGSASGEATITVTAPPTDDGGSGAGGFLAQPLVQYLLIGVIAAVIAGAAGFALKRRKSRRTQSPSGPEWGQPPYYPPPT